MENDEDYIADIALKNQQGLEFIDPRVICDKILAEGVENPIREDGEFCRREDFPDVKELRLSRKNIIEISNLELFTSLTTLRLDNNIIQKVHGLDSLRNLTWLDVSFNNLKDMNGLDALVNLTDLVLADNQIDTIAHCVHCTKLQVISLARNNIKDLDQVNHLRQFRELRDISFAGNKIAEHENYKTHVVAYIPQLEYLDHKSIQITPEEQATIETYHADDLTDLRDEESKARAERQKDEEDKQYLKTLEKHFLGTTFHLSELLLNPMLEPYRIDEMSADYAPLKLGFHESICELVANLARTFEPLNDKRLRKVEAFEKAIQLVVEQSDSKCAAEVAHIRRQKKEVVEKINAMGPGEVWNKQLLAQPFFGRMEQSQIKIQTLEVDLKQTMKQALNIFQDEINALCAVMLRYSGDFWGPNGLEQAIKQFHSDLHDLQKSCLDEFIQSLSSSPDNPDSPTGGVSFGAPDFSKEEFQIQLQNFEECHTNMMDEKGTQMDLDISSWKNNYFAEKQKLLHSRRCVRVDEVSILCKNLRGELEAMLAKAEHEEQELLKDI
eukprot:gene1342-387_t